MYSISQMILRQVFIKRIVSHDGKILASAKSIAIASSDGESEINQKVAVNIASDSISSSYSSSSSNSSQSVSSSISISSED